MTWQRKPNKSSDSSSSQCLIPKMLSLSWFLHIPMQNRQLNNHCCRNSKLLLIFRFVNVSVELFVSISTTKLCARFCVCFWCCFNFSASVSTAHILWHLNNRATTQILYYLHHHKIVCSIAFRDLFLLHHFLNFFCSPYCSVYDVRVKRIFVCECKYPR